MALVRILIWQKKHVFFIDTKFWGDMQAALLSICEFTKIKQGIGQCFHLHARAPPTAIHGWVDEWILGLVRKKKIIIIVVWGRGWAVKPQNDPLSVWKWNWPLGRQFPRCFQGLNARPSIVDMFIIHFGCPGFGSEWELPLELVGSGRMQPEYIFGSSSCLHSEGWSKILSDLFL